MWLTHDQKVLHLIPVLLRCMSNASLDCACTLCMTLFVAQDAYAEFVSLLFAKDSNFMSDMVNQYRSLCDASAPTWETHSSLMVSDFLLGASSVLYCCRDNVM